MDAVTCNFRNVKHKMLDLSAVADSRCDVETLWAAIRDFRQAANDFETAARRKRLEQPVKQ